MALLIYFWIVVKLLIFYYRQRDKTFQNFLKDRKQFVQVNNAKTAKNDILAVESGVQHGCCLVLFILLYFYKYEQVVKICMGRDGLLIFEYARLNKLKPNANKTKIIGFRPRLQIQDFEFNILVDGNLILETQHPKYFLILLQTNPTWNVHINEIKINVASAVGNPFKMENKFILKLKLVIYQTLIYSHINYMTIILAPKNYL